MAKRIFISFAVEDVTFRDFLVGQARNEKSPFEFVDMSVKEPWDSAWKTKCRTKIKGCDGVIAIVSKNTAKAAGALWEIECAVDEGVKIVGIHATTDDRPTSLPQQLRDIKVVGWTWANIKSFIDGC